MWTLFKGQILFDNLCLYSAFLGTQSALHSKGRGGGGDLLIHLIHHQCAASTRSAHHTPDTGGEKTVWWSQSVFFLNF